MLDGSYDYILFFVIQSSILERGKFGLSTTLGYSYCIVDPIVVALSFLNRCFLRLTLRMRIYCEVILTCRWVRLSTTSGIRYSLALDVEAMKYHS